MENQVRILCLLQSTPERFNQVMRKLPNKSDRIRHQHLLAARQLQISCCRIQRCKKLILFQYLCIRQRIKQCGFSRIRISYDGSHLHMISAALFSGKISMSFDILKFSVEKGNPVLNQPSIHLQFLFSRSSCANSSSQTGQCLAGAGKLSLPVTELSQLHLDLPFTGRCSPGKDIQDDECPIHYLCIQKFCQIRCLCRGQFIITNNAVRICFPQKFFDFLNFPLTNISGGMNHLPPLNDPADDHTSCRIDQIAKLIQ